MSSVTSIIVSILTIILSTIYLFFKYKYNYWSKKNVPHLPPQVPWGNVRGIGRSRHSSQILHEIYQKFKGSHQFVGVYFFVNPVALAIDLELIKNILIKDFVYFQDRGLFYNEKDDPLSANLFSLDSQQWKGLRHKLTPTFTSGKMKFMFSTIVDVAEEFQQCLTKLISENQSNDLELRDLLARFTTDVIGTCAFGINCNSLTDPNAQFRKMGKKVFAEPRNSFVISFLALTFRNLARALHIKNHHDDVTEFFMGIVKETIEYREKNKIHRSDFMDLLIDIKNNANGSSSTTKTVDDDQTKLSIEQIAAQAFVFFLAGFETSSTTMSYALHELSLNLDIQNKARQEIENILKKYDGKLTYEAMMDMHYIDHIISESLRKYPPGANLIRIVGKDYSVPGTEITLDKNTLVMIPVYAIHHDPEYYPDPEKFEPNRFTAENSAKRPHMAYLPFGEGPRNCIGLRFGMMQARIGLIMLLKNFQIRTCSKSVKPPLEFKPRNIVLTSKGGLWLKIEKI